MDDLSRSGVVERFGLSVVMAVADAADGGLANVRRRPVRLISDGISARSGVERGQTRRSSEQGNIASCPKRSSSDFQIGHLCVRRDIVCKRSERTVPFSA
jgi:hypothetical protein